MGTTSLKLPEKLRRRVAALAKREGVSPHAFMVHAIERQAALQEERRRFIEDALEARREFERTGIGYALEDVAPWFEGVARGEKVPRRRPR